MKKCKVENCGRKYLAKGFCNKHYKHILRYGKILKRTRSTPNEIIDCGNYAEIVIYNVKHKEVARAKIDKENIGKASKYKWRLCNYYIANRKIKLHQLILGRKDGYDIDHINHDKLDNRKKKLRHCTRSQNNLNRKKQCGVCWKKRNKKWHARIGINHKEVHLGYFTNKEEAIKIRKKAELKYF